MMKNDFSVIVIAVMLVLSGCGKNEHMKNASAAKKFRIKPEKIEPLVPGLGGCFASDRITVDGVKVGYMYREASDFQHDSGWRFLAGDETQGYLADPAKLAIYDVNSIANYDKSVIPLLNEPVGSAFERDTAGNWNRVPSPDGAKSFRDRQHP